MKKIFYFVFYLIIFLAIITRISTFYSTAYYIPIDDCHSLNFIDDSSFKDLFFTFTQGANFLPLYRIILKLIYSFNNYNWNFILFKIPSLIFGISSIFVFYQLINKLFKDKILITSSLLLFALNYNLIWNSTRIKPYALDILLTLIVLNTAIGLCQKYNKDSISLKRTIIYTLSSCICIFASIPFIMVTEISWLILFVYFIINKNISNIKKCIIFQLFFSICLIFEYMTYIYQMKQDNQLKSQWINQGFYYTPDSFNAFNALIHFSFFDFFWFDNDLTFKLPDIVIFCYIILFLIGTYKCIKPIFTKEHDFSGLFIILPVYFTVLLSFAGLYPFCNRPIIFLIPIFIIITFKFFNYNSNNKYFKIVANILAVSLLISNLYYINSIGSLKNLLTNNYFSKKEKYLIDKLENQEPNKIIISTETICMKCLNNNNIYYLNLIDSNINNKNIIFKNTYDKKQKIYTDLEIKDMIKTNKLIYFTYKTVDNVNNETEIISKLIEKEGFTKIKEDDDCPFSEYSVFIKK